MKKIVIISDTHNKFNKITIPECDLLISCGDYSFRGTASEVKNFHKWLNKQPAKYKISIQGNHERGVEKNFDLSKQIAEENCPGVYFIDEGLIEIEGLKIWCSAITPEFCNWAWNRQRGEEIKKHWDRIPNGVDIIATHGPVKNILDECPDGFRAGCEELLKRVLEVRPKYHFCGHIHMSYGVKHFDGITFVNASICDEMYLPINEPVVIELE
jgi:Icc-related predicted phosphoesterase